MYFFVIKSTLNNDKLFNDLCLENILEKYEAAVPRSRDILYLLACSIYSQAPLSNRMSGQMAAWYLSKK